MGPWEAISGYFKSLKFENPCFKGKILQLEAGEGEVQIAASELLSMLDQDHDEVLYRDKKRWVKSLRKIETSAEINQESIFKDGGIYLVTGGAGGIGLILAQAFSEKVSATFILTGRTELSDTQRKTIEAINGSQVLFFQSDITDFHETQKLIATIKERFGALNGVIHAAGIIKDKFVLLKERSDFKKVLEPKIGGLLNLDFSTQDEPLDFFIVFSSIAAIFGSMGQSDYASANRFMDSFIEGREFLRSKNLRSGKNLSLNWPLWEDGGMQGPSFYEQAVVKSLALVMKPPKSANDTRAADPIANPFPIAAVVFPAASNASVLSLTS
jgi:NADP-dependent 3-hydroxy acid dehydrogenase YdfG